MARFNVSEVVSKRYKIVRHLGEGAQSCVYLVDDLALPGAQWALKQLRLQEFSQEDGIHALELFKREGQILQTLSHPAIPRFVDSDYTLEDPYIVMERVLGTPMQALLDSLTHPLSLFEAIPIALQITHILNLLHTQEPPIIYRDLKPSNLILTDSGLVRLLDFGIARFFNKDNLKDTQELGTPGYSAPEQYRGNSCIQSDIYSLGVILFFMFTLKDPQDCNFIFPSLKSLNDKLPSELSQLVAQCLDMDDSKRPTSALEVQRTLFNILKVADKEQSSKLTRILNLGLISVRDHVNQLNWNSQKKDRRSLFSAIFFGKD
ncbi:serine/threonine protein kinase [bacterium]|nr:serine/threonine protein kinase [bacterium]